MVEKFISNKLWLLRRKDCSLEGPMEQAKLLEYLSSGSLTGQDEICPGSGYWILLREQNEVQRWLGQEVVVNLIVPPQGDSKKKDSETTAWTKTLTPEQDLSHEVRSEGGRFVKPDRAHIEPATWYNLWIFLGMVVLSFAILKIVAFLGP